MMIPFDIHHFDLFNLRHEEKEMLSCYENPREALTNLAKQSVAGTLFHDGRVVGIMGYLETPNRVFEVWAFPSIYVEQYPLPYLRHTKKWVKLLEDLERPTRIQTISFASSTDDHWMQFLGFTPEAFLPKYFGELDGRVWSKTY